MARLRVTAAMRKQLAELREAKRDPRRGGVMIVPRMLNIEEFDAIAPAMQMQLMAEARDEAHGVGR